jgi:hypothetical protein
VDSGGRLAANIEQKPIPADEERGAAEVCRYNWEVIARAISMTSTLLAALWPIAAFFVLNLVNHTVVTLILNVVLTLLFAATVNVITTPTRTQIFVATTTYVQHLLRDVSDFSLITAIVLLLSL